MLTFQGNRDVTLLVGENFCIFVYVACISYTRKNKVWPLKHLWDFLCNAYQALPYIELKSFYVKLQSSYENL